MSFMYQSLLSNLSNGSDGIGDDMYAPIGRNVSDYYYPDPDTSEAYILVRRFQTVLIPFICVFGILGNVLAAAAFLSPELRGASCCLYLASKSFSDIGFLFSLFVVWLYRVHVPLLNTQGICQTTVFFSYVCGFLSVWFVVVITFENFIRIARPWMIAGFCGSRRAVILIVSMVIATCSLYSFSLWTNGIIPEHNPKCQSFEKYRYVALAMANVDTFLTLVLPSIAMFVLVIAIMFTAFQAYKRKLRLRAIAQTANGKINTTTPESKVSRFLFAVSIVFLVLHTPSHVVRMRLMVLTYLHQQVPSITDLIIQRLFETFLYLNFGLSCVIYLIFGDNFRRVFRDMYFGRCFREQNTGVRECNNMAPLMPGWSSPCSEA